MVTSAPAFSQIPSISWYHSLLTTSAAGKTYTIVSSPQPLSKNELVHYHMLRWNTLERITKGQVNGLRRQNLDFVFSLPMIRLPTGCTGKHASSDSYSYEYEPEGTLLHPHAPYLTILSLLHPMDRLINFPLPSRKYVD